MSKITNDGLTRSGTGHFIAVPIWQQWVPMCMGLPYTLAPTVAISVWWDQRIATFDGLTNKKWWAKSSIIVRRHGIPRLRTWRHRSRVRSRDCSQRPSEDETEPEGTCRRPVDRHAELCITTQSIIHSPRPALRQCWHTPLQHTMHQWVSSVLRPHQHSISYTGDGLCTSLIMTICRLKSLNCPFDQLRYSQHQLQFLVRALLRFKRLSVDVSVCGSVYILCVCCPPVWC